VLREELGVTGCKIGLRRSGLRRLHGAGDGVPTTACATCAFELDGTEVTTVAGLAVGALYPIQRAFLDHGAFQRGFCTPA
jgi:aerobic carbon-monoxide dehydrogenase small subunit